MKINKSEVYLLVIHCMGAMIHKWIDIWSTHPTHLFGYYVPGSALGNGYTLVNKNTPSPCRAGH